MPLSSPPLAPLVWLILPRGDIIPGLAPPRLIHHIPGQPRGPGHLRGLGPQAQGSRPPQDPERHPHRLIRALLEPRTYPLHPLSGDPTSIVAPSRGMLTAVQEIYTGRFTTISRHLLKTRSSETPCSLCSDTTWAIHDSVSIFLSSGSHRVLSHDDV